MVIHLYAEHAGTAVIRPESIVAAWQVLARLRPVAVRRGNGGFRREPPFPQPHRNDV